MVSKKLRELDHEGKPIEGQTFVQKLPLFNDSPEEFGTDGKADPRNPKET